MTSLYNTFFAIYTAFCHGDLSRCRNQNFTGTLFSVRDCRFRPSNRIRQTVVDIKCRRISQKRVPIYHAPMTDAFNTFFSCLWKISPTHHSCIAVSGRCVECAKPAAEMHHFLISAAECALPLRWLYGLFSHILPVSLAVHGGIVFLRKWQKMPST